MTFYDYLEEYMEFLTSGKDIPNALARCLLNTESDYEDMKEAIYGKDKNYYDR